MSRQPILVCCLSFKKCDEVLKPNLYFHMRKENVIDTEVREKNIAHYISTTMGYPEDINRSQG